VLQPEYNLYHRSAFEGAVRPVHQPEIGVVTYYSLASGFLTGKYRQQADLAQSQRGSGIGSISTARNADYRYPGRGRRSTPCKTG
jgi:aryl-alcohol dehydrogenase-like predicted oxidoreductase